MHAQCHTPKKLIGKSVAFLEQMNKIPLVAKCDSSVLISGETGTGKELCAQSIHHLSLRDRGPFVPINCGAIPTELAENELFGHKKGAFTGAGNSNHGLICEAEGGTLFLDEIDSLPQLAQIKLLRFLQEKTYRPLGSPKEYKANVRVIAATGIENELVVKSGRLRQDLFYRLNVISLRLPPLRERREDIPLLSRFFLKKYATRLGKEVFDVSSKALQKLLFYDWPGNVRELEHVIERAVVFTENKVIEDIDISLANFSDAVLWRPFKEAKEECIKEFERTYIEKLLFVHRGNISKAARIAQKHRRAFWELIRKHEIDVQRYKVSGHAEN
ncbi:MAG: sigma-54 dependent transcriptional regulator [Desulforhabdus sp.]|jgi:DNA-binding NtrC family response regulator|nr:sigma-54 dependent transcriptional regulator [Desulforhabdus sp.]